MEDKTIHGLRSNNEGMNKAFERLCEDLEELSNLDSSHFAQHLDLSFLIPKAEQIVNDAQTLAAFLKIQSRRRK